MAEDLRAWRARLRWTQARAAAALLYDLDAYKKLEAGRKPITPRLRRFALLVEREHVRSLYHAQGAGPGRMVFSTSERAAARLDALDRDGGLVGQDGQRRVTYLSLFSGLEGATAALERIGSDAVPVAFADVDPASNALCRHRWPDVPRLGDITDVDWSPLRGRVDVVLGGPPCQSFSVAGRRLGLGDPRGNLALHYLRTVGAVRPRWFVLENVPGLLSANEGADFGVLVDAVEELGYGCAWRTLDAHRGFGLPQRRARLWLVGERDGDGRGPCQVLALGDGDQWRAAPGRPPRRARWKADAARLVGRADREEADVDWSLADSWLRARDGEAASVGEVPPATAVSDVIAFKAVVGAKARGMGASTTSAPTLASASGGNRVPAIAYVAAADLRHGTLGQVTSTLQNGPAGAGWSLNAQPVAVCADVAGATVVRRFTPRECERLQGLDDGWTDGVRLGGKPLGDGDRYRLLGNAWPVPVAAWLLERLLAVHAASGGSPAVEDAIRHAAE